MARRAFRNLPPTVRTVLLHARGDYAPWEAGFDFTPPAPGPGEVTGPPDFVGVGAQKAGTSWWYELIVDHPDVFERPDLPKERQYLAHLSTQPFGPDEVARYHGWFPRTPGSLTGEWSPDYLAYPWVAPLLAQAAPDAKVLVLLRDPVDRFRSGLTFRQRMGAPRTEETVADAVRQGFYARWLSRLLEFVPREQVLVQQYERCREDPETELARTYAFLGLDPFRPAELRREVNVSGGAKVELSDDARARLAEVYRDDLSRLPELVPDLDLGLWPSCTDRGAR